MLIIIVRTFILYFLVVIAMRLMGKQEIGQLQPFELVIAILIAELAAIPIQETGIPLINGIVPILLLIVIQVLLSYACLKSEKARAIICGTPSILIEKGRIVEKELKKQRCNINDLLEQLRAKNYPNIADIEFAILETNGELSVIPKAQKQAVTCENLNIKTNPQDMPINLIIDGKVNHANMAKANVNMQWLEKQLAMHNITDPRNVLLACLDTERNLFIQPKSEIKNR